MNIKYVARHRDTLNVASCVNPAHHADLYLLLTGTRWSSRQGAAAPWVIGSVYLFDSRELLRELAEHGSVPRPGMPLWRAQWKAAEVYPQANNPRLVLTARQRDDLGIFAA